MAVSDELNDQILIDLLPKPKGQDQTNNPKPTKGFRLIMPFTMTIDWSHRKQHYYRHGIKHEVREWLLRQVGATGSYVEWQDEDTRLRWLYTGSNQLSYQAAQSIGFREMVDFRFREKGDAMLFKLAWWGRL